MRNAQWLTPKTGPCTAWLTYVVHASWIAVMPIVAQLVFPLEIPEISCSEENC